MLRSVRQVAQALRLFFLFRMALVALIFVFIFRPNWLGFEKGLFGEVDPIDVVNVIKDAFVNHPQRVGVWLGFACVAKLLGITAGVIRWKLLLRGQGLKMPLVYMVYLWFMGRAIGLFLPGTLGLDGFRMVESSRYTGEWIKCTTVIVIEKIIGFVALGFILVVTFPLGMHLVGVNATQLPFILVVPLGVVVVGLLLLLNPRVIQVGMATIPTPGFVRNLVNKFGVAATAYSGNKFVLVLAVLFGVLVHTGTIFMYFGCRMAVGVTEITIQEVLFASTLTIGLSVLTPTVSGLGVRELVGKAVVGVKVGAATGIGMMHLGLWCGELVPYLLSVPLLLWGGRPSREQLEADVEELRARMREAPLADLHLTPQEVSFYRRQVFGTLTCGLFAGAYAGAVLGMAESAWLFLRLGEFGETGMFWWGVIAYGVVFAGVGLGIGAGFLFLCLLVDAFPRWFISFGAVFGASLGIGGLGLGVWRFQRDVLAGHFPSKLQLLFAGQFSAGVMLEGFLIAAVGAVIVGRLVRHRAILLVPLGLIGCAGLVGAGYGASIITRPAQPVKAAFTPTPGVSGPNVVFIGLDALRADYLRIYEDHPGADNTELLETLPTSHGRDARARASTESPFSAGNTVELSVASREPVAVTTQPLNPYRAPSAETPAIEAFARDSVLFEHAFAQASWTKPSFATMFTGLYPEQHGATNKGNPLPADAPTIAELLRDAGYYTQGFPNNPWLSALYHFDRGHVGYEFLEPDRIFGAPASAANLAVYGVLHRMVKPRLDALLRRPMNVRQFYHPAEDVTEVAIDFLEHGRSQGAPFYLYLHYMDSHDPFMDPSAPRGGYARASMDKPDPAIDKAMEDAYILEIKHLDRYLGELFDGLKRLGLYDDTLIIVTGDHGEEFYDHGGWWHGQTLYDELIRVPLLLKLPGNRHGGVRNADLARHIDLAPTILHFAGLPKTPAMPGQSLFDDQGNFTNASIETAFAHNDFEGNVAHAARSREMKLIHTEEGQKYYRGLPPVEFYDLGANPEERWEKNLADDATHAAARQAFEEKLGAHARDVAREAPAATPEDAAAPEPAPAAIPQHALDQLGALGYVD